MEEKEPRKELIRYVPGLPAERDSGIITRALEDDLRSRAEKGDCEAMIQLGDMYGTRGAREPEGSDREREYFEESIQWYLKAFALGALPPMNQYGLAFIYAILRDSSNDETRRATYSNASQFWIGRAAEAGVPDAQMKTGLECIEAGDSTQGIIWLKKAIDHGHVGALTQLGLVYALGRGVPRDLAEAKRLLSIAADAGDADAKRALDAIRDASN